MEARRNPAGRQKARKPAALEGLEASSTCSPHMRAHAHAQVEIFANILPKVPTLPIKDNMKGYSMTYGCGNAGRVSEDPSNGGRGTFWTFEVVEGRLIEAMLLWRRSPDRERGWLHVKAFWPEIRRFHWATAVGGEHDHPEQEPQPRALPLTRAEVAAMNEAADWFAHVPERDRKLMALALTRLANGDKQVPWLQLKRHLGVEFGAHGLRKRYTRAIAGIAETLNRAEIRKDGVSI